jgi:hypothetical protein
MGDFIMSLERRICDHEDELLDEGDGHQREDDHGPARLTTAAGR